MKSETLKNKEKNSIKIEAPLRDNTPMFGILSSLKELVARLENSNSELYILKTRIFDDGTSIKSDCKEEVSSQEGYLVSLARELELAQIAMTKIEGKIQDLNNLF